MSTSPLPFGTRLWLAWVCFFQVLFDGIFARGVWTLREGGSVPAPPKEEPKPVTKPAPVLPPAPPTDAALQLLALLQREGRLVDFLEQDIATFGDADVGAAARVVHDGCRKALRAHATIAPVRAEEEGARVTIAPGFDPNEVKLSGNVAGAGPYAGVLRHRGWRASAITLPVPLEKHDARVLAPAEVEL